MARCRLKLAVALTCAVVASAAAQAQQYPCWNNRTPFQQGALDNSGRPTANPGQMVVEPDVQSSLTWQQLDQAQDYAAMQQMMGTWYIENQAPQLNMVQHLYQSFEANGLYEYRDQVCGGATNACGRGNQGTGQYRAVRQADGSISFMVNFSDLNRSNACVGGQVYFPDTDTMVGANGNAAHRMP